jgi:histidine triad (HIT) family protein
MPSIFSRIVAGEIPSYRIAEDERFYAFLDINPLAPGHTLVIPKKEVDYLFDVDDDTLAGLLPFAGRVARAIERVVPCARIGVTVIGLEVPHAHVHLIPIRGIHDMDFSKPKVDMAPEAMEALAAEIRAALPGEG